MECVSLGALRSCLPVVVVPVVPLATIIGARRTFAP
jgi:hypothetical protein